MTWMTDYSHMTGDTFVNKIELSECITAITHTLALYTGKIQ